MLADLLVVAFDLDQRRRADAEEHVGTAVLVQQFQVGENVCGVFLGGVVHAASAGCRAKPSSPFHGM
ncbi:hypothetical protein D3C76_885130 [compost metagenome]